MSNQRNWTIELENFRKRMDLYKRVLDEIDVGVHVIDETGKTIIYNSKMMEIESMDREDVLEKKILDVFVFADNQYSTLIKALETGQETRNIRQTYFNNKGVEITTINDTFPIIEEGTIKGAIEITKDVTRLERVIQENVLKRRKQASITFDQIIGRSPEIQAVIEEAKRATRTSSSVMIIGETGTGKELFAESIHNGSDRSEGPFIAQNCAAIPDNLMESLLFGTKKGAFTGALDRSGLFEQADKGTLLLDEINSLNPALQAKLLRVLQTKTFRRIGDTKDIRVDVRIIATINEDPMEAVLANRLRKDLYYRLSVVALNIPPLRERKPDIELLAWNFIDKYNSLFQMKVNKMSRNILDSFNAHDWPGNVRELEHTIEGAMNLIIDEDTLTDEYLPMRLRVKKADSELLVTYLKQPSGSEKEETDSSLQERMDHFEKKCILDVLEKTNHNISQAAKILGIRRQSLQYRMKKFELS
jgi:arginine utilization regulatory protein